MRGYRYEIRCDPLSNLNLTLGQSGKWETTSSENFQQAYRNSL
jgi:hypothetical protein